MWIEFVSPDGQVVKVLAMNASLCDFPVMGSWVRILLSALSLEIITLSYDKEHLRNQVNGSCSLHLIPVIDADGSITITSRCSQRTYLMYNLLTALHPSIYIPSLSPNTSSHAETISIERSNECGSNS